LFNKYVTLKLYKISNQKLNIIKTGVGYETF
jgi:hypothetical protein